MLVQVTLLGVSKMIDKCIRGRRQQSKLNPRADYACFEEYHFEPMVVTTQPYEPLSHATLEWLKENQDKCNVLQVCNHLAIKAHHAQSVACCPCVSVHSIQDMLCVICLTASSVFMVR